MEYMKTGRLPCPLPAFYIRECDLRECFMKAHNFGNNETETRTINICKKTAVLCIDDIGVRNSYTDNDLSMLFDIIDTRYNKNLPLVITSNLTPEEIKNIIGDRCYDRIKSGGQIITIAGTSYRLAKE